MFTDNEQKYVLSVSFPVTSADTDMFSRLRPGALINFLIQSAILSADSLGFGFGVLKEEKLFWVLNRISVEIYKPVLWKDTVTVQTWPKTIDGILYIRDFILTNQSNDIIAKATSAWLAIDFFNKRPKLIEKVAMNSFTELHQKHALQNLPQKLPKMEGETDRIFNTSYFDIDLNKHVTATRYVDWMFDCISVEIHKNKYPSKLDINYMKETPLGEDIRISIKENNNIFKFEGTNIQKNVTSFRGIIYF